MGRGAYRVFFYSGSSTGQPADEEESESDHLEVFNGWYKKLTFEEQTCFIFDVVPSKLTTIFWSHTQHDIVVQTKLKLGLKTVTMTQEYVSLLNAAGAILGSEKSGKPKTVDRTPKDEAEAMARAALVFG